ncbi:phage tail sheath family protein [Lactobacillus sp. ESL0684]|uniref:phage tail sheath family protein n=1 Tax=Lactobacillus sp. ESL0684 TaxID=2983213 RepID=UPI0023F6727E|nr:phage tail sheath family protein [Lactobacillus sp. ESL0684]WEV42955.1 phage tail sheath family protein [Lactobacillus sp. ESL0684]
MAGGTWKTQNKRRPGAYVNVKSTAQAASESSLGRTLLLSNAQLGWGAKGVIELHNDSNFKELLGTTIDDPKLLALKQVLKGAETVLFLNTNDGVRASLNDPALPWKFVARYPGTKGNDISISLEKDPNNTTIVNITTLFGTEIVDEQTVTTTTAGNLLSNDYVSVTLTAEDGGQAKLDAINAAASYQLTGGTTSPAATEDLMSDVMETENYSVVTTAGYPEDSNIHSLLVSAVKRLRDSEGMKIRGVIPSSSSINNVNYEGISMVANGLTLNDGTTLSVTDASAYFAGLSSSADAATSLTYYEVEDAISANPKLNNDKTIKALDAGQIVFTTRPGQRVVIEQDVNSLTKFTQDKHKSFSKNRVMRTLDEIATDTEETFEKSYLGKVGNNANGRDLFKANRVTYLQGLNDSNIIQDFSATDVAVEAGIDSDSVVVDLAVKPVDSMEKLYVTINVG